MKNKKEKASGRPDCSLQYINGLKRKVEKDFFSGPAVTRQEAMVLNLKRVGWNNEKKKNECD